MAKTKNRKLRVDVEKSVGNEYLSIVSFSSDETVKESWLEEYLKNTNVVFTYSAENPRTKDDGSDRHIDVTESSQDFDSDRVAFNHNTMIGKIVDYYVSDEDPRLGNTPSVDDYLTIEIDGVRFDAGFNEVKFTKRKACDFENRKINVDVYHDLSEYEVQFIKDAWIAILPSLFDKSSSGCDNVDSATNDYLKQISYAIRHKYTLVDTKVVTVPATYKGEFRLYIEKDGKEILK